MIYLQGGEGFGVGPAGISGIEGEGLMPARINATSMPNSNPL
jgi:hypothetical protein